MITCPSCGQSTERGAVCLHCGASLERRLPLSVFRWGSLALAVLGVVALLAAARRSGIPEVTAEQIEATMNLAYVRVAGTVSAAPTFDAETKYLTFRLDDGTGEIFVASFRAETEALIAAGKVPALGDRVTLEGTLRVREDFISLSIAAPEHVTLTAAAPEARAIAALSPNDERRVVRILGQVREIKQPFAGLTLYRVRDSSGDIDVALTSDTRALTGQPEEILAGDTVVADGAVTLFRGAPQLTLTSAAGIRRVDETIVLGTERQTGSLGTGDVGALVQVSGVLAAPEPFAGGVKFALDDGSGPVTLLLWQDLYEALTRDGPFFAGDAVQVFGEVRTFQDEVEVVPQSIADVARLAEFESIAAGADTQPAAPTPAPTVQPTAVPAGVTSIANAAVGDSITIQGDVVLAESYAGGFKFGVRDHTGTLTLLLPEALYRDVIGVAGLRPGALVRAAGAVGVFQGDEQLEPVRADDVEILQPGAPPADLATGIGSIQLGDINTVLTVAGDVTGVEEFSAGVRLNLSDASGSVIVLLWQNVFRFVPNADQIVVGSQLRATGKVEQYQGALEIIPQIGFDVELLGP